MAVSVQGKCRENNANAMDILGAKKDVVCVALTHCLLRIRKIAIKSLGNILNWGPVYNYSFS